MAASGVLTIGDSYRYEIGDGQIVSGSVSLAEGKEASSVEATIADPDGELANGLPLILVEDVPAQRATVDVTFVAKPGFSDSATVPAGTELKIALRSQLSAGGPPNDLRFRTTEALGPSDFGGADPNVLRRARATVEAEAARPGAAGNISGGKNVGQGVTLELASPVPGIARAYHTAPATGGSDAGKRGEKVPVECWLGPSSTETPEKLLTGYLSQLTFSGPAGTVKLMAVDASAEFRREQRARALTATNVDDLVGQVAALKGFDVDLSQAELEDIQITRHVQHGETDWQMLNRILEGVGHRLKVRGETVYVTKVGKVRESARTEVLRPPDVSSYSFEVDELTKKTTPNLTAVSGAKASEQREGTPSKSRKVQFSRLGVPESYDGSPSEIDQEAERAKQAEARKHRLFRASLETFDLYEHLDTDDQVVLESWGRRFNGTWWIESLTHDFDGTTSFQLTSSNDE